MNYGYVDLSNPLEGTFDLSQCGYTGNYLSISTGYRKVKKPENADKVEIWFTPRFLVEKEIKTSARHLAAIFPSSWSDSAPVGMLWTYGNWDDTGWYEYLTNESMDNLSKIDLYENWRVAPQWWGYCPRCARCLQGRERWALLKIRRDVLSSFVCELKVRHEAN